MKGQQNRKRVAKRLLVLFSALALASVLLAAVIIEQTPGVPNVFSPKETAFQQQTHFLVFTENKVGENATSAKAYYNAIDPAASNRDFKQWLKNAGFIGDVSQWHPSGKQLIACNQPGCDLPAGTYGDNVINTDSHAIVVNAADLGFVRSQFIRCIPSCTAPNPTMYTYLENYPVNPFAASGNGGSGFPFKSGFPTQAEATAAIDSALNRPLGALPGCDPSKTDTAFGCKISRIADVAFAWAPSPTNPNSAKYGQIYAFIFNESDPSNITETIASPTAGASPNLATGVLEPFNAGDPFAPNLDFIGNKQNPGVCLICHGGYASKLTSAGAYPNQGNISGFRFLPLDIRNLIFTSDAGPEATSRLNQAPPIKEYNRAVLNPVTSQAETDDQGFTRVPVLRDVIQGWYAASLGDTTMSAATQNADYIPPGWREPVHGGTAPPNSEVLYTDVVSLNCRSCHFNRELSLDLGTAAMFLANKGNVQDMVLLPLCQANNPAKGYRPMPLAHLTFQRFWQANKTIEVTPSDPLTVFNTAEKIANYLGYSGTAGYCAVSGSH